MAPVSAQGRRQPLGTRARAAALLVVLAGCSGSVPVLPPEIDGWRAQGPDGSYGPEDLHTYIDGAAEVYRALGVRRAIARRYAKPGAPEIVADVFEMGSPDGAFGAFHHDLREGVAAGVGRESEQTQGLLAFWKGRFFVSVMVLDDDRGAQRAVRLLAERIASSIPDDGRPPALVRLLPGTGWTISRVRLVPDHLLLNRYYFLADADLLGLDGGAAGILARVRRSAGSAGCLLLLVGYPLAADADRAERTFAREYLRGADATGTARTEDGRHAAVRRIGERTLAIALEAPDREEADGVLEEVARRGRERAGGSDDE